MAVPFNRSNLSAGELAPHLWGRTDLQKYQAGAKVARNFFVDYRGGSSNRAGTALVGVARVQTGPMRKIPFKFGSGQNFDLVLDAGQGMQIVTAGGMLTEAPIAISAATRSAPLTVTMASGTWTVGDMVVAADVVGLVRTNGLSGINGRTFFVAAVSGLTLTLISSVGLIVDSTAWTAYTSGGTLARIYTVATPWLAADLFDLHFTQSADVLTVTHTSYGSYDIKRLAATNWTVTPTVIGTSLVPPTGIQVATVNNPGGTSQQFFYAYAVSTVNDDTGEESNLVQATATVVNAALNQNTGVVNQLSWSAAVNATSYRIYKAQPVPNGSQDAGPYFYGLIGTTKNTGFHDVNYQADFTTTPPVGTNPFQSGGIVSVTQATQGFGYISPTATAFDTTGFGAVLTVTKNAAGAVTATAVAQEGADYSAPIIVYTESDATAGTGLTFAFSGSWVASGGGFVPAPGSITIATPGTHWHVPYVTITVTGAAAGTFSNGIAYCTTNAAVPNAITITRNPFVLNTSGAGLSFSVSDTMPGVVVAGSGASGLAVLANENFPGTAAYFDQRRVFAGSLANPDTFWMTRPGLYSNMDVSFPSQADDAITGTIVGQEVNKINSLTAMTSGLIALTISGAWQIAAAGSSAIAPQALTPSSATAGPQAFSGASALQPLRIINDLVFESALGLTVRSLTYNFYLNIYSGTDILVLSSHLLQGHNITQWTYAEQPFYLIWAVRDDGILLSCCYLKEQELYGWSRHDTNGIFVSVTSIPEGQEHAVYFVTRRAVGPAQGLPGLYFIERMASRLLSGDPAANIPTDPEDGWFLDCAVEYPLTEPDDTLLLGLAQAQGQLDPTTATIDSGGTGFAGTLTVFIEDPTGTGATATATQSGGVINSFVITANGSGYTNPTFRVVGSTTTGTGYALSARPMNLTEFVPGNASTLASIHVGDVVRVRGGKGTVKSFTSNSFMADMVRPLYGLQANSTVSNQMPQGASGKWSCTTPVSIVGGLDHLTGATVSIVADGNVIDNQTVVDGCITLAQPASRILVGLPYTCQLGGLRFDSGSEPTVQGRRKQLPALTLRSMDTRGVLLGSTWDTLVEAKERTTENYGQPIELQEGGEFLTEFVGVGR